MKNTEASDTDRTTRIHQQFVVQDNLFYEDMIIDFASRCNDLCLFGENALFFLKISVLDSLIMSRSTRCEFR